MLMAFHDYQARFAASLWGLLSCSSVMSVFEGQIVMFCYLCNVWSDDKTCGACVHFIGSFSSCDLFVEAHVNMFIDQHV